MNFGHVHMRILSPQPLDITLLNTNTFSTNLIPLRAIDMPSIRLSKYFVCFVVFNAILSASAVLADSPAEAWEYGELRHYERRGTSIGPDKSFAPEVNWLSGDGFVQVYGWDALADKLNAAKLKNDVPKDAKPDEVESLARIRLLNHFGSAGWQLVSHERTDNGNSLWIFKRRVTK